MPSVKGAADAQLPDELHVIAAALQREPELVLALIFGSRAGPHPRFDSDLDVAVLGKGPLDSAQRVRIVESLAAVAGTAVDLIDLAVESGVVARAALLSGRLLFCRSPERYQERLRQLVYDAEDFLPPLRRGQQEAVQRWIRT